MSKQFKAVEHQFQSIRFKENMWKTLYECIFWNMHVLSDIKNKKFKKWTSSVQNIVSGVVSILNWMLLFFSRTVWRYNIHPQISFSLKKRKKRNSRNPKGAWNSQVCIGMASFFVFHIFLESIIHNTERKESYKLSTKEYFSFKHYVFLNLRYFICILSVFKVFSYFLKSYLSNFLHKVRSILFNPRKNGERLVLCNIFDRK